MSRENRSYGTVKGVGFTKENGEINKTKIQSWADVSRFSKGTVSFYLKFIELS